MKWDYIDTDDIEIKNPLPYWPKGAILTLTTEKEGRRFIRITRRVRKKDGTFRIFYEEFPGLRARV